MSHSQLVWRMPGAFPPSIALSPPLTVVLPLVLLAAAAWRSRASGAHILPPEPPPPPLLLLQAGGPGRASVAEMSLGAGNIIAKSTGARVRQTERAQPSHSGVGKVGAL